MDSLSALPFPGLHYFLIIYKVRECKKKEEEPSRKDLIEHIIGPLCFLEQDTLD